MIFAHRVNVQSGTWRDFVLTHVPHPKHPTELGAYPSVCGMIANQAVPKRKAVRITASVSEDSVHGS